MVDLNLSNSSAQPEIGAKVEDKKQKVPTQTSPTLRDPQSLNIFSDLRIVFSL